MGLRKTSNEVQEVTMDLICITSLYCCFLCLMMFSSVFSFDELLELSQKGDNSAIDMLVGDIYGGMDYSKV